MKKFNIAETSSSRKNG